MARTPVAAVLVIGGGVYFVQRGLDAAGLDQKYLRVFG